MTPFPREDYRGLTRYTPDRAPVALDLSDNTNLWGTPPAALDRIRSATIDDLARYPELYADTLREAVATRFGIDAACVTTGAGSDDVLDSAFRSVWGEGETVRYVAPTFSMTPVFAQMNGLESVAVPWPEAVADPSRLLEGDPALVYVCRPNNPTGELVPTQWVERLIELRGDSGPLIVLDEAYADFCDDTFVPRAPNIPRLLVARTASKAYGLAGLRCGFAVGSREVALEIEKSRGPYKFTQLATEAAALAVLDADGWMAASISECIDNRERLWKELHSRGLNPFESSANFILFAPPNETNAPAQDIPSELGREAAVDLRKRGVGVRPFTGVPGMGDGLRVTVGPWPLMERFLAALDKQIAEVRA
jgi:histidinol-phosphate aminotransferase